MEGTLRNMTAVYLLRGDEVALLYRINSRVVEPSWCGVGGHFEPFELNDAKACVLREMEEEIQLTLDDVEDFHMRYITLRLKNNEIRQNYYFFAHLKEGTVIPSTCEEGHLRWVNTHDLFTKKMPFSAKCMLEHYVTIGCHTPYLYAGISEESGIQFHILREFETS